MPIFVDGVEINGVHVDGVEIDSVFVDGVEVYTGFEGELYIDTFIPGGNTVSVPMNTGQNWSILKQLAGAPYHNNGAWGATGSRVSVITNQGVTTEQQIQPIVTIVNQSYVAHSSHAWSPPSAMSLSSGGSLYHGSIFVNPDNSGNTRISISGITGSYTVYFYIAGIVVSSVAANFADVNQCDCWLYYDGTDIAGKTIIRNKTGSTVNNSQTVVFPRQSAQGQISTAGRNYWTGVLPLLGGAYTDCSIYDVSEEPIPPGDIPWP